MPPLPQPGQSSPWDDFLASAGGLSDPQVVPILWRTQHQSDVLNPNVCRDLGAERTSACRDESILASPKGLTGEPLLSSVG